MVSSHSLKFVANPDFLSVNAFFEEASAPGKKGFVSALRPYSPGGPLNGFPTTLASPIRMPMSSGHRLQPGLRGSPGPFLHVFPLTLFEEASAPVKRVNLIPFAPLAFVPHRRIRSSRAPFAEPFFHFLSLTFLCRSVSSRKERSRHRWSSRDYKIVNAFGNLLLVRKVFYPYPWNTLGLSRSQARKFS